MLLTMHILILIASVVGLLALLIRRSNWHSAYSTLGTICVICLVSSPVTLIPACNTTNRTAIEPKHQSIVSLKNVSSTEISGGGSFLGWSIDSERVEYYVVMGQYAGETYRKIYFRCDETFIKESDEAHPHIEYDTYRDTCSKWFRPSWLPPKEEIITLKRHATIVVPVGTVIRKIEEI